MATKKPMKKITAQSVKIFKIENRRGFAALCRNNLTEGNTPLQAYERMRKATKRISLELQQLTADKAKKLIRKQV